jgi:hypothetical protein
MTSREQPTKARRYLCFDFILKLVCFQEIGEISLACSAFPTPVGQEVRLTMFGDASQNTDPESSPSQHQAGAANQSHTIGFHCFAPRVQD